MAFYIPVMSVSLFAIPRWLVPMPLEIKRTWNEVLFKLLCELHDVRSQLRVSVASCNLTHSSAVPVHAGDYGFLFELWSAMRMRVGSEEGKVTMRSKLGPLKELWN